MQAVVTQVKSGLTLYSVYCFDNLDEVAWHKFGVREMRRGIFNREYRVIGEDNEITAYSVEKAIQIYKHTKKHRMPK